MQARSFGNALAAALLSIALMLGALSISLVEYAPQATFTPSLVPLPSITPGTLPPAATETSVPQVVMETATETASPSPTATATAPSHCPIPPGWGQVIVQPYEGLESIAARYRIAPETLRVSNCLLTADLIPGTVLYVPPVPTNTAAVCRPGAAGWSPSYTVLRGDTFYSIAARYGVHYEKLKAVNCRAGSDKIYAGEVLWVPIVAATNTLPPTLTPIPGDTLIPYPTDPLTETPLPFTATFVPSPTIPPPDTPTPYPTLTASPTAFP